MLSGSIMKELYRLLCPSPCYIYFSRLEAAVLLALIYSLFEITVGNVSYTLLTIKSCIHDYDDIICSRMEIYWLEMM
jgi:hypothetical protein